jgi:hypothetical protein
MILCPKYAATILHEHEQDIDCEHMPLQVSHNLIGKVQVY